MTTTKVSSGRSGVRARIVEMHHRLYSESDRAALKHAVVWISVAAFLIHLVMIFAAHWTADTSMLTRAVGRNYLSAVSTPFNVILFYEVLTLIAALPASTTRSIANQFEIVSLIFIRDVFKDIAAVSGPNWLDGHLHEAWPLLADMGAGLLMFVLVTVFQHVATQQVEMPRTELYIAGRKRFTEQKKMVASGLAALLVALAAYHLGRAVVEVYASAVHGREILLEPTGYFYNDVFNVMIFADVFVAILSLRLTGRYEMVFRNAAYVTSIILIRFALMERQPYDAGLAILATVFAIITSLVFNYHSRIRVANASK